MSNFQPAEETAKIPENSETPNTPLFQGSLSFQPFKKDPSKQERYDQYLVLVKQGVKGKNLVCILST